MKIPTLLLFLVSLAAGQYPVPDTAENTVEYWMGTMRDELNKAMNLEKNLNVAKNVILFVGDGMGITASTAGRIYKGQKMGFSGEEHSLVWENFPYASLIKTYNLDSQVADSASTATSFFSGTKTNFFTVGCTPDVVIYDHEAALNETNWVTTIADWAHTASKDVGLVTTSRITHATPAALYAHTAFRYWECDQWTDADVLESGTKDIARQLVEDETGKNLNVIFGGGRSFLGSPLPDDDTSCSRLDSRNLTEEWLDDKEARGFSAQYVTNTQELSAVDLENTDYIMGLFGEAHTPYEIYRDTSITGTPSLRQMTEAAIQRLQRNDEGFVLVVEGGLIDSALHKSRPLLALEEISALDEAVTGALQLVNTTDTLIVVCADHSHVMTFNGYPERGNDILGTTTFDWTVDKLPYPTLMFTVGPGFPGTFYWNGSQVIRSDISEQDTTNPDWVSPSIVETIDDDNAAHGGEDIGLYAIGPMSHLFHNVHEQPYIAHVMSFAACIGPYTNDCERTSMP